LSSPKSDRREHPADCIDLIHNDIFEGAPLSAARKIRMLVATLAPRVRYLIHHFASCESRWFDTNGALDCDHWPENFLRAEPPVNEHAASLL
jgi:hypothetical protein